jgi:hypothetical protein
LHKTAIIEKRQFSVLSAEQRPSPEFLYPLAIRKTRAGLQFTCAAATAVPTNADYTSRYEQIKIFHSADLIF